MDRRGHRLPFCVAIDPVVVRTVDGGEYADLRAASDGSFEGIAIPPGTLLSMRGGRVAVLLPPHELSVRGNVFRGDVAIRLGLGQSTFGILAKESVIDGVHCAANTPLRIDSHGRVALATLASDQRVDGFVAASGTAIEFFEGLLVCFEPVAEIVIDGVPCAPRRAVRLVREGPLARPSLFHATLARERMIDGVACAAGRPVTLMSGRLAAAWLAQPYTCSGFRFRSGTYITGLLRGGPCSGTLDEDSTIDGVPCAGGFEIRRTAEDGLTRFTLSREHVVDGMACLSGHPLRTRRDPDGALYALALPQRIAGQTVQRGDVLARAGAQIAVTLGSTRRLGGIDLPAGSELERVGRFGRGWAVKLASPIAVEGHLLPAGTWLELRSGSWIPMQR